MTAVEAVGMEGLRAVVAILWLRAVAATAVVGCFGDEGLNTVAAVMHEGCGSTVVALGGGGGSRF